MTTKREPTLFESLIPIIFLILLLVINVGIFGSEALGGSNQIVLILSAGVAAIVAFKVGNKWEDIQNGIVKSISSAMASILILLLIGSLAGTWMLSGVVPAMIYYGLQILNPTIFLVAACIVCSIVSVATGSSWTTAATVGIALIGIGQALGISEGLVAGAILSGAYFGDKMSPLSDTTNLAPAMAGTDLFTHIRYMTITTVPSILLSLTIFLIIGLSNSSDGAIEGKEAILSAIDGAFNINGWLFIVPVVVVVLIVKKMPALPALLIGTLLGAVFALIFQPDLVALVAATASRDGELYKYLPRGFSNPFIGTMQAMFGDISFTTGNAVLDDQGLLSASGMAGMLGTIWLIISAMIFGGVMEGAGMLKRIASAIISKVNSTGSLVTSTVGTCIFFNGTASDQYLALVVPGRMYADTYKKKGLAPENLSRTLEDSGTVTSVLIPWNTCGAYHASVLGVATGTYFMYCFFNIISPFMTILVAYTGYKIKKLKGKGE
ncbi:transporter, NhaC family [Ekhidna lutea]|uniref:Transporter, NhaC family n=1 Tax=Ekhidna lutea TaxID=447679 RepID=A0A239HNJ5_EKHLU|nr:Na+/H+ antiporter NhaC [Ekhidna lutea]SNS82937.1 transporter, NhaC family [Ekhidna lutea]